MIDRTYIQPLFNRFYVDKMHYIELIVKLFGAIGEVLLPLDGTNTQITPI